MTDIDTTYDDDDDDDDDDENDGPLNELEPLDFKLIASDIEKKIDDSNVRVFVRNQDSDTDTDYIQWSIFASTSEPNISLRANVTDLLLEDFNKRVRNLEIMAFIDDAVGIAPCWFDDNALRDTRWPLDAFADLACDDFIDQDKDDKSQTDHLFIVSKFYEIHAKLRQMITSRRFEFIQEALDLIDKMYNVYGPFSNRFGDPDPWSMCLCMAQGLAHSGLNAEILEGKLDEYPTYFVRCMDYIIDVVENCIIECEENLRSEIKLGKVVASYEAQVQKNKGCAHVGNNEHHPGTLDARVPDHQAGDVTGD